MLKKESTLYKERDGRIVYYIFSEEPPRQISPFWFTRIFCTVPAYFHRASYFSQLYHNAKKIVREYFNNFDNENERILIKNLKFIIGVVLLNIFKHRSSKCIFCQFSSKQNYVKIKQMISLAIKDRSDVLPEGTFSKLIEDCSEIPIFGGMDIQDEISRQNILNELLKCAETYKKDIEFQVMVSIRRQDLRLKQQRALEEEALTVLVEENLERGI